MKNILQTALALLVWITSGCATMFSPRRQKVTFSSATPQATISYQGDSIGNGIAKQKFMKSPFFHAVQASKTGYISRSHAFEIRKKLGATAVFAVLDLSALFFAPFVIPYDLKSARVHRFKPKQTIPALTELKPRQKEEKYVLVSKTSVNAQAKDFRYRNYKRISKYNKKKGTILEAQKRSQKVGNEAVTINNTIFTDELNSALIGLDFFDTSAAIFTNADNSVLLNATIKKVMVHRIARANNAMELSTKNELVSVQLEIDWTVLDYYKQPVFTKTTENTSDLFLVSYYHDASRGERSLSQGETGMESPINRAVAQNFQFAFAEIRSELLAEGLLNVRHSGSDTEKMVRMLLPKQLNGQARLNEMLQASVTVKTETGHGSGILISNNGYVVTNYHVIAGETAPEVILANDQKIAATIVRVSKSADLALLKIEKENLTALRFSEDKDPEIGIEVWAMGTPRSLELGQSVSKGIVSGRRTSNDINYLQTDAKVSPGNSGGALINKKGEIMGIVSMKLTGTGTEGVSFAISAEDVINSLNLSFN